MKKKDFLFFVLLFISFRSHEQQNIEGHVLVNGVQRDYVLHLPLHIEKNKPLPLVFIFHGGGGNSKQMQRYIKMDAIADRENFITVYPQGLNKQWNDGRAFNISIAANDDVKFVEQLLDTLEKSAPIDPKRVFATGISNGAFFSIYLSYKLSRRFLAIAPVCGSIPKRLYDQFFPSQPVSLLLINGTGDPLVPYDGGTVGNRLIGNRGECVSTDKTIERFINVDKTSATAVRYLPDTDRSDGCTAMQYTYNNGANNSEVILIKIINGGHTWPGGIQYLPEMIVGRVCRDFNASETIWEFFKNCPDRN
ncbi:MAG TPA: PHB depolymerase family esterase [Chitinophagaceae bacterium]|nr:PHB depolymerase family esterase [Chitinophagaceae bacterium]